MASRITLTINFIIGTGFQVICNDLMKTGVPVVRTWLPVRVSPSICYDIPNSKDQCILYIRSQKRHYTTNSNEMHCSGIYIM